MKISDKRLKKPVFTSSDWTITQIEKGWDIINGIAQNKYQWGGYDVQFEILSSNQFIDMETSVFMPVYYNHWSFGKHAIARQKDYDSGRNRGLAYECIINTSPSICYVHEDNNMMMQLLVTAHAAVGHNHFFKNNYLFKEWTQPEFITDYLIYAKHYISKCEAEYGEEVVSSTLDIAHLLKYLSIFKYRKSEKTGKQKETKSKSRMEDIFSSYDPVIDGDFKAYKVRKLLSHNTNFEASENVLYFLELSTKHQSRLLPWQKEVFSIVRTLSQYFYPQMQTKMMNEGFASFVHYTLMNELYDKGYIDEGYMLDFISSHVSVVYQPDFSDKHSNSINPYYLGFNMFMEVKRICENPTEEDKEFCPTYAGSNYIDTINHIVANYRDESFIRDFLSPSLIRKLKLFSIETKEEDKLYKIGAIHNKEDYDLIRNKLAEQYSWQSMIPEVEVTCTSSQIDLNVERANKLDINIGAISENTTTKEDELRLLLKDNHSNKFNEDELIRMKYYLRAIWKSNVYIYVVDNENSIIQEVKT